LWYEKYEKYEIWVAGTTSFSQSSMERVGHAPWGTKQQAEFDMQLIA